MFVTEFGFTGLSFKRGKLLGSRSEYPVKTVRLLIVTITVLPGRTGMLFREALEGLIADREWFVKNAPTIRIEKRKAVAKARAQAESSLRHQVETYRGYYSETKEKLVRAEQENRTLRAAIKIAGT